MAKIDIRTNDMASLSASLKKISSAIADAEKVAAGVQSGLDFQVAAKSGIDSGLSKARKSMRNQNEKVTAMSNLTAVSGEEFANADGQMSKNTQSIIGKMLVTVDNIARSIKNYFSSLWLTQRKDVSDIFMTSGSILGGAALGSLIGKIPAAAAPKKEEAVIIPPSSKTDSTPEKTTVTWSTSTGGKTTTTTSTTEGGKTTTSTTTTSTGKPAGTAAAGSAAGGAAANKPAASTTTAKKAYDKLAAFDKNKFKGKTAGAYSNYSIVPNMKPEYVVRQGSYESPEGFAGGGCTSCTYWTIAAAYKGTTNLNGIKGMKPTDSWTGPVGAANSSSRTNPASIYTASKKYKGEEQYLETIYKNLVNGTPIGVRMQSKTGRAGHTVSCIGLKNGTDIEAFKKQLSSLNKSAKDYTKQRSAIIKAFQKNILIADSADGKIKTLDAYTIQKETSLWYPDGAKMLK